MDCCTRVAQKPAFLAVFERSAANSRRIQVVPLAAMFLSDLVLGLHALIPIFTGVLFGWMAWAEWRFPRVQPACT
jgi:hypothetical protein